jgi:hypothetical protein
VGSSSSTVTLYDITSGRLLAVQRLMSGPGAVQSMAAWVPPQVLAGANLAPGGPLASDGGGLLAGGAWSALRQSVEQDNSGKTLVMLQCLCRRGLCNSASQLTVVLTTAAAHAIQG